MNKTIKFYHGECEGVHIIKYPDGQQTVQLDLNHFNDNKQIIEIIASVRNWSEMEVLLCIVNALHRLDYFIEKIHLAYVFGMRSDRMFKIGQPNYFQDLIQPIFSDLSNKGIKISILCAHGRLSLLDKDFYRRYRNYGDASGFDKLYDLFDKNLIICGDQSFSENTTVLNHYDIGDFYFIKKRNGNDISVSLTDKMISDIKAKFSSSIIVADDLCDGGATFIEEAKYLKEIFPEKSLQLFFYHALCTKGVDHLLEYYDKIYCTNSYQYIRHPKVEVIEVI